MKTVASLFAALAALEKEFDLQSLDSGERRILMFIMEAVAKGKQPTSEDILGAALGSRASVYRWVSSLRDEGFIDADIKDGQSVYSPSKRFANFPQSLAIMLNRVSSKTKIPKRL